MFFLQKYCFADRINKFYKQIFDHSVRLIYGLALYGETGLNDLPCSPVEDAHSPEVVGSHTAVCFKGPLTHLSLVP